MIERKPFVRNGHTRSEQWIITILCKKAKKNAKKRAKIKIKILVERYGLVNHEKKPLARKGMRCNN